MGNDQHESCPEGTRPSTSFGSVRRQRSGLAQKTHVTVMLASSRGEKGKCARAIIQASSNPKNAWGTGGHAQDGDIDTMLDKESLVLPITIGDVSKHFVGNHLSNMGTSTIEQTTHGHVNQANSTVFHKQHSTSSNQRDFPVSLRSSSMSSFQPTAAISRSNQAYGTAGMPAQQMARHVHGDVEKGANPLRRSSMIPSGVIAKPPSNGPLRPSVYRLGRKGHAGLLAGHVNGSHETRYESMHVPVDVLSLPGYKHRSGR